MRNIVDASAIREIQDSSAYAGLHLGRQLVTRLKACISSVAAVQKMWLSHGECCCYMQVLRITEGVLAPQRAEMPLTMPETLIVDMDMHTISQICAYICTNQ